MPKCLFGGTSSVNTEKETGKSLFVQETFLKTYYTKGKIEEDIDLENQFRIKTLPDAISIREPASNVCVVNTFNNPSVIKALHMLTSTLKSRLCSL